MLSERPKGLLHYARSPSTLLPETDRQQKVQQTQKFATLCQKSCVADNIQAAEVCLAGATYFCLARAPPLLRLLALLPGLLSLGRAAGALPSPAPGGYRLTCSHIQTFKRGGGRGGRGREASSWVRDHWYTHKLTCPGSSVQAYSAV